MPDTDTSTDSKTNPSKPESTPASPPKPVDLYRQVMQATDHYETLGIKDTATTEDIEAAFKKIEQEIKLPDKPYKSIADDAHIKKLQEARNTLTDTKQREDYDEGLKTGKNKTKPLLPDELPDEKNTKQKSKKLGTLSEMLISPNKKDDDYLLNFLSSLQNMLLQNSALRDKLNVFTAIPRMIMAAPDVIKAAPDNIIDAGKKIMDSLQEGLNKFKDFFKYQASDKKDDAPKESPTTTPKKEITATNPMLSAVSDTQGTQAQLNSLANSITTSSEIETNQQNTQQAVEAGLEKKQQAVEASTIVAENIKLP